jgi:flagellar hook assembly protein FlgD
VNSVYAPSGSTVAALSCSPNPFSPDGDGHEDATIVSYRLPATTGMMNVKVFDIRGRIVRWLANNEPSASYGSVVWDGRDQQRRKVRIGMYVILVEFWSGGDGCTVAKSVVVVTGRL